MAELSRDDVITVLGRVLSDAAIAEIIATGVTKDELAAARERALRDHKAHDPGPPLEPGRFAHAVEVLERLRGRGIIGEGGSTLE
ncbi:MAG: hypothetical protein QOF91_3512 [Alphaproteobacteria bacterium]|jgi:hypothetical protein|nr:hypothetical protein [Alphaproteobacteria bacterium]